jgi:hypothetical protein
MTLSDENVGGDLYWKNRALEAEERLKERGKEIAYLNQRLAEKNRELDAMGYVWCTGGCGGGMFRNVEPERINDDDLLDRIQKNAERVLTYIKNLRHRRSYSK